MASADVVLAATSRANPPRLEEEGYPPVIYIPFEDINFANLRGRR